jgi:hypothetical protein
MSHEPPSGAPFTESIDGDISGKYGFRDGHVELAIRLPAPFSIVMKEYTRSFREDEFQRLKAAIEKISKWYDLSPEDRKRLGAP